MLKEIEIFRTVMTCGTASKAARLLHISQPAVSQALQRLEKHAAVALFIRLRGRLHPTPEAYALLSEVERCFVGLDAIEHRLRSLKQFGEGRISVASLPALGVEFLPRALAKLDLVANKRTVSLQIMSSKEVRERILARQANIGLMAPEVSTIGLQHSEFSRLRGVIAIPRLHPLAHKALIHPSDLHRRNFISLNPEDVTQRQMQLIFDQHHVVPNTFVETPYAFSICEMVKHGMGIGLINPLSALAYSPTRHFVIRPFSEEILFTTRLVMPADDQPPSGFLQGFLALLRMQLHEDTQRIARRLQLATQPG